VDQELQTGLPCDLMPAIFGPRTNSLSKLFLVAVVALVLFTGSFTYGLYWSSYVTDSGVADAQPVAFSHKHHVGELGLDCRYCHTSVEKAASAGMPSTHTCMTCHSQIWQNSPILKKVRESEQKQIPIAWNRLYRLPDYVYFNHSIHVGKGIGCASCHGQMDEMPIALKHQAFYMRQCLDCHRNPEKEIRPVSEVFNMKWRKPADQEQQGLMLVEKYHIQKKLLTDCITCHR
jgi:hypothetical protein